MESLASRFPETGEIEPQKLAFACEAAVAAAASAGSSAQAIDLALDALHDELGAAGAAAFVLEHGRLWSVGVRGYAMIPDGLPLDEGVIGRAVRTSEIQLARDVTVDPDFIEVSPNVVSELAIPLLLPTGVVGVINVETANLLPAESAVIVAALGPALAPAMDDLRGSRSVDLSSLARLFVYMSSLRDSTAIAEVAVRSLGRVLPLETAKLLLLGEEGELFEVGDWSSAGPGPDPLPQPALEALRSHIDDAAIFELLDSSTVDMPELDGLRLRSVVLLPLRANGVELGLLVGTSRFARSFDRPQAELASLLAAHAAASLDAAIALDRERRSAHTDPLTGLLNRRGLEERLERELSGAQEERKQLSLIVLDCDDFKDVNDRAGHEYGDALLREVGLVLNAACPEEGSAARMGGDEFLVMLPGADAAAALATAERIRGELGVGLDNAGFPLRLSGGVSTYPYDGAGSSQLIRAADQALYRAKARGKNCAIAFREIVHGTSAEEIPPARSDRTRVAGGGDVSALGDAMDAATAIWAEDSVEGVLERLGKAIAFVVGATATAISKVEGNRLFDTAIHSLRDVRINDDDTYLIDDYPVTKSVLESRVIQSLSFLDEDLDDAEAFVLRELQMNAAMLVPFVVHGRSWGLLEIYDMRLRRFTSDDEAVTWFLVGQAARRIESLGEHDEPRRHILRLRPPSGS